MEILEFTEPVGTAVVVDDVPEAPRPEAARKKSKRSRGSIVKVPTKTISDCLDCEGQRNDKLRVLAIKLHNEEIVLNNRRLRKQWKVSNRRFKSGVRAMREDGDLERDTNGGNAADGEARYAAEELILDRSGSWSAIPTKLLKGETNDLCYFAAVSLSPKPQKAIDVAKRIGVSSPTTVRAMVARLAPSSVKGAADDGSSEDDYIQVFNGPHGVKMVARLGVQVAKNVPDRIVLDRIVPTQRRWKKSKKMALRTNQSAPPTACAGGSKNSFEVKTDAATPDRPATASAADAAAAFWSVYPGASPSKGGRKGDEERVRKLFNAITTGTHPTLKGTADDLIARARGYARAKAKVKPEHIRAPLNWLRGEEWTHYEALPPPPPPPWWKDDGAAKTDDEWEALIREHAANGHWDVRALGPWGRSRLVPQSVVDKMKLDEIFNEGGTAEYRYRYNDDGTLRPDVFAPLPPPPPRNPDPTFEIGERVRGGFTNDQGRYVSDARGVVIGSENVGTMVYYKVRFGSGRVRSVLPLMLKRATEMPKEPSFQSPTKHWPFKPGDKVHHGIYGFGVVASLPRGDGRDDVIDVTFGADRTRNCRCESLHDPASDAVVFGSGRCVIHTRYGWGTVTLRVPGGCAVTFDNDRRLRECKFDELDAIGVQCAIADAPFSVGDRVQNPDRGLGTVQQVLKTGKHFVVKFDDDSLAMGDENELAPAMTETEAA